MSTFTTLPLAAAAPASPGEIITATLACRGFGPYTTCTVGADIHVQHPDGATVAIFVAVPRTAGLTPLWLLYTPTGAPGVMPPSKCDQITEQPVPLAYALAALVHMWTLWELQPAVP